MANKQAAVSKKVTKVVAKKAVTKRAPKDDGIYWAVVKRGFLTHDVVELHRTREKARDGANKLDEGSGFGFNMFYVKRVELTK